MAICHLFLLTGLLGDGKLPSIRPMEPPLMPGHSLFPLVRHTTVTSIAQLSENSTGLNVTGHLAGKPVSGIAGQDSSADSALYRSVDGFASAKELNPTPKTMERPHVAAGQPTRVGQCRASRGEAASVGRVVTDRAGLDSVPVLGDRKYAGPFDRENERQREVNGDILAAEQTAALLAYWSSRRGAVA